MNNYIKNTIYNNDDFRNLFGEICYECTFPAKTVLLNAGDISRNFYFIEKGSLRLWFNQDGKDITMQFFFEGQGVASIESFVKSVPSMFFIETIEPTVVKMCNKEDLFRIIDESQSLKEEFYSYITDRLINYTHLFLSRIKDAPRQRYINLIKEHPEIIKRVPQHYIASYLGITSVSLSRIRNRK